VTQKMPVVFMIATDPVKLRLFDSRNRPRADLPCIVMFDTELNATRLELLRELITKDAAIALFVNPKNPNADLLTQEVEASPTVRGHVLQTIGASSEAELKAAFTTLRQRQVAVIVEADPVLDHHLWSDRIGGGILRCDVV
jgi:putative tryptophan/tyrosine transport system substrate-binding protein